MPKKGFTMVEILTIVIIVSIGLLTIIAGVNNSNKYVQKLREKTIAINLAREGIEAVMNIRNTNRQRWEGKKDQCRLKTDPGVDKNGDGCENDSRMQSGTYLLQTKTQSGQQYFILSGNSDPLNENDGFQAGEFEYVLCESGGNRMSCPGQTGYTSKEGMFFRQIQIRGLFDKITSNPLTCTNGSAAPCGEGSAKELRYCSKVAYTSAGGIGNVELCHLLTNFKK